MTNNGFFDALAQLPPLQRALAAGALAGVCCASLSPFVVLRRMAFVGDGLAHAAFGGIGLGLYVLADSRYEDAGVQWVTVGFCLALGFAIAFSSRRAGTHMLSEDSAIGIAFSVSMALGALLIKLRLQQNPLYVPPMDTFLFGTLMNIGRRDIYILCGLTIAVIAMLSLLQKELLFYTFNASLAEVSGLDTRVIHYLFMLLLVLTVVVSSRVMGIVLVSASLVIPGVISLKLCARLKSAIWVAAFIGLISFTLGMYVSYEKSVPAGSSIILIQFFILLIATAYKSKWPMM